jgi:two-component system OmpR family sensor kinase
MPVRRSSGPRFHSLQRTLALRYGLTMFVALLGVAGWAYLGVARAMESQLDGEVGSAASLMVDVVVSGEPLARHTGSADLAGFVIEVNRLVVARDSEGNVVETNSPLANGLPLDTIGFRTARAGMRMFVSGMFSGVRTRTIYAPVPRYPGGAFRSVAVIQVAVSREPMQQASESLLLRLILTGLIGTLVTTAGAGWLARSSLEPVADIAAQARAVTGRGGEPRITAHANVLELRDLIAVLNEMLARLERALRQQRRIVSDVGHELRTPITVIRGEIEVALRGERRPEQYQALLRSILEEAERLGLMGDELIALSRYEAGELVAQPVPCDLRDLVHAAAALLNHRAPATPLDLRLPDRELRANLDPRLIGMALEQLVDNALRHTLPGTAVAIAAAAEGDHAVLTVEDAGPGVPDDLLADLAEPFFRLDQSRGRGGTGLGLTLVAAIVALHGGRFQLARSALGGLSVRITLPGIGAAPAPTA